jgi:hypothetical protein
VHDLLLSLLHTAKHVAVFKSKSLTSPGASAASASSLDPQPVPVVAAKLLWTLYRHDTHWPLPLLEAYLDDALECRVWVESDDPMVVSLCSNLVAWMDAGAVKFSSDAEGNIQPGATPINAGRREEEEEEEEEEEVLLEEGGDLPPQGEVVQVGVTVVRDRFSLPGKHQRALTLTLAAARAKASAKNTGGGMKPLVKALGALCVLPCVRLLAVQCLPQWLGNPALVRTKNFLSL